MKKLYLIFTLIATFLYATPIMAQQVNGNLKGRITTSDGKPAEGISITLDGTSFGAKTNELGEYKINKIPQGTYSLKATAVGLLTAFKSVIIEAKETVITDFSLQEDYARLQEVVISTQKNHYKVDKPSGSLRLQGPLLEAPQNIKVVTKEIIAQQQVFDMVDGITRNVSGAMRSGHWDSQYANISMRGTSIPAFRNGINVKMPWGPLADDMSTVERVEFVKGPAGFMMANGEPGGIYNVVTKKPTGENKSSVSFSAGSYNTARVAIDLDGKLSKDGRFLYRLNLAAQDKDTYNKYNYNKRYVIAPVISYQIDSATIITAEYTHQHVEAQALGNYSFSRKGFGDVPHSFFMGDPALDPRMLNDHNAYIYLDHQINENWKFSAKGAYFNYSLNGGGTVWPSSIDDAGNMIRAYNIGDELATNKIAQFMIQGRTVTGSVVHHIIGGLDMGQLKTWGDFSSSGILSLNLGGNQPFNIYNPVYGIPMDSIPTFDRSKSIKERSGSNAYATNVSYNGIYVQDELRMLDEKLRLTLAARFTRAVTVGKNNDSDLEDNVVTPRFGLSYSFSENFTGYGLFDQSFLPQAGEDADGNKFVPIKGNNIEFGLKKDWLNGKWNSTLSVYQITKKNVLTADPRFAEGNPQNYRIQIGEIRSRGIELDVTGELAEGLELTFNYAYTEPKVTKDETNAAGVNLTGTYLNGTAKHISNGWLSYRFHHTSSALNGFGVSGGYQMMIDRFAGSNQTKPNFIDYYRFDAGISYERGKFLVSGVVNNLLNQKLYTSGSIATNPSAAASFYNWIYDLPTNFRLSLTYKFIQ